MISSKSKMRLTAGAGALLLAAGGIVAGASPAAAAYSDCPYGRVCVFEGWNGTGLIGWATQCGRNEIVGTPLQGKVSSVKTHGNGVTFYNYNNPWFSVAEVGPWTQTNLSPKENDSPDWMYVDC